MPRYTEILKANGLTDVEVAEIEKTLGANPKAVSAFDGMVIKAEEERKLADEKLNEANAATKRLNDYWETEATPQINDAYSQVARAQAEAAYYKKQAESARESGFLPGDAPGAAPATTPGSPTRNADGTFTPSAPAIDTSKFMTQEQGWKALNEANWAVLEYQRLNPGQVMPDDVDTLVREATSQRLGFHQYVESKYKFPTRREEIKAAAQKEHDDKIRAEATAETDRKWAERVGSNPDSRIGTTSKFSKFAKDSAGANDRLSWTRPDAKDRVRQMAHEAIAKEQVH